MRATCVRTWIQRAPMCEFHFSLPHCGYFCGDGGKEGRVGISRVVEIGIRLLLLN